MTGGCVRYMYVVRTYVRIQFRAANSCYGVQVGQDKEEGERARWSATDLWPPHVSPPAPARAFLHYFVRSTTYRRQDAHRGSHGRLGHLLRRPDGRHGEVRQVLRAVPRVVLHQRRQQRRVVPILDHVLHARPQVGAKVAGQGCVGRKFVAVDVGVPVGGGGKGRREPREEGGGEGLQERESERGGFIGSRV